MTNPSTSSGQVFKFQFLLVLLVTCYLSLVTPIYAQSKEEQAVYNLNQGLVPPNALTDKPPVENKNILDELITRIKSGFQALSVLFIGQQLQDPQKTFSQSEVINNSGVPEGVQPKDGDPVPDQQTKFLGKPTGTYGVSLPSFKDLSDEQRDIKTDEKSYECGIVPCDQGVHPITP